MGETDEVPFLFLVDGEGLCTYLTEYLILYPSQKIVCCIGRHTRLSSSHLAFGHLSVPPKYRII